MHDGARGGIIGAIAGKVGRDVFGGMNDDSIGAERSGPGDGLLDKRLLLIGTPRCGLTVINYDQGDRPVWPLDGGRICVNVNVRTCRGMRRSAKAGDCNTGATASDK